MTDCRQETASDAPDDGSRVLTQSSPGRYRLRSGVRREGQVLICERPLVCTRLNDAAVSVVDALSTECYRSPAVVAAETGMNHDAVVTLLNRLYERDVLAWEPARDPAHTPPVSVVVTVRNAADHIDECLDALAALSYPEYEVIIVDDGSTDGTRTLVANHGSHPRLVTVGTPAAALGIGSSREAGVEAATHEVVAFTDADCRPDLRWLAELVPALAAHDIVGGRVRPASDAGAGAYEAVTASLDMGPRADRVSPGGSTPYLPTANFVARRAVLSEVGFPDRNIAEDVHCCWTALDRGYDVVYDPRGVVEHVYDERRFGSRRRAYGASEALLATEFDSAGSIPLPVAGVAVALVVLTALAGSLIGALPAAVGVGGVALAAVFATASVARDRIRAERYVGTKPIVASLGRRSLSAMYLLMREFTRYYSLPIVLGATVVLLRWPTVGSLLLAGLVAVVTLPAVVEYVIHRPATSPLRYLRWYLHDHFAYQVGVYRGAVVHRTGRHLDPMRRFNR